MLTAGFDADYPRTADSIGEIRAITLETQIY
jgi:hypothetical protein